jgi:16S rRNA (guanine966-N2)-methyltransferase
MRIIAGEWRGSRLEAPPGEGTRPTLDRVRQALFDRLMHAPWAGRGAIEGAAVLDAFAGTGALGLEALSRGAAGAVFIERDRTALAALRANVAACRAEARCRVIAGDALRPPPGSPCGVVFLDPPYGLGLAEPAVAALQALASFTAGVARVVAYRAV